MQSTSEQIIETSRTYSCSKCAHKWKTRKTDGMPKNCPSCRSTVWMKPYETKKCARCGNEWGTTSGDPRRCPGCGTYHWNEAPQAYHCMRCNHDWTAKRKWPPKRCPQCRSVSWMTERRESADAEARRSAALFSSAVVQTVKTEYASGMSCTQISVKCKVPFSVVYDIVRGISSEDAVRV